MTTTRTFVDGRVHVRARRCATCIFHPGDLMRLGPDRVAGMVADADTEGTCIPCHSHLYVGAPIEPVCRGYFDRRSSVLLRLADALGIITYVPAEPDPGRSRA